MKPSLSVALPAAVLAATLAAAQAAERQDPIVVSATRFAASIDSAPVNVSVIDALAIRRSGATTLAQVLDRHAGVYVQDLFGISGSKSRVDMGGFGATGALNTLVLLNGRRLNDVDLSGANLGAIALDQIERIEIIHGSATVLYGDNAVGGVINIVTKSGLDAERTAVQARLGSFSTRTLGAQLQGGDGAKAYQLGAETLHSDGYRDNSAFDTTRASAELSWLGESALAGLRLQGSDEQLDLPGALNEPVYRDDPTAATLTTEFAQERRFASELFFDGEHWAGELALSDKHQEASVFGDTDADLRTVSLTPRTRRSLGAHRIVAGADLYHSALETHADFGAPFINRSDTQRRSVALYATDSIALNPRTALLLGVREQLVTLDIENIDQAGTVSADERKDKLTAWELGLSHHHADGAQAYVRLAESFRFPVLDEMWSYFSGTITPLRPQRGRHIELGMNRPLGAHHRLAANLFQIRLDDEIAFDNALFANVNLDQPTRHRGIDLELTSQLTDHWTLRSGYGFREAVFRAGPNEGKRLPEIPRHRVVLSNEFAVGAGKQLTLDVLYTGRRHFGNDFANAGKEMADYAWVNLAYRHEGSGGWSGGLSVINLLDQQAADAGFYNPFAPNPYYYYPLPGRAAHLFVERAF